MDDMSHSWDDLISEILSMLVYGWSWHEIVYKQRVGPYEKNPKYRSKHTDGRIGWRKIPIRAQETLLRWSFQDDGSIQAMIQLAPPKYQTTVIPIDKSLLFRTTSVKNNPEGRSILRNAYRSWYMKKRLEEYEGIGVERDLAGLPVGKLPASYFNSTNPKESQMLEGFRKMVRSVRRDEQEGVLIPQDFDQDTKQPLFDFQLLASAGSRQFDTNAIIQRYEQRMLMTSLADFILVGHEDVGSYAMVTDKSGMFRTTVNSFAQSIAEVFNRYAIPRLFAINGWKLDELPQIVPNNVDPPNLTELAGFMTAMAQTGITWFPDPELEGFIRDAAGLPQLSKDMEQVREFQQKQNEIMQIAQQQLGMVQMKQQAEMGAQQVAAGPEDPNQQAQQKQELHGVKMQGAQQQNQIAAAKGQEQLNFQRAQNKQKLGQNRDRHQLQMSQARKKAQKPPPRK
jgi:hypothetical protein